MNELIKQLSDVQELMDKTLLEIGLKYSIYHRTEEEALKKRINEKIELYQKLEMNLKEIERKIREMNK